MFVRFFAILCLLPTSLLSLADLPEKARRDAHGFPLPEGTISRLGDLRFAQPGSICALALSPDGKTIATARSDGRIFFWNANTGRIVRELAAIALFETASPGSAANSVPQTGSTLLLSPRTARPVPPAATIPVC